MNLESLRDLSVTFLAGTLGQGGAERQLYYMATALKSRGARVRVLALTRGEYWEARLAEQAIGVTYVGESRQVWKRVLRIAAELRGERPAVVHSQHFYTNPYARLAAYGTGAGVIGSIRSDLVSELAGEAALARKWALKHLPAIAANSRAAIETAIGLGVESRKLHFLPNVVDAGYYRPCGQSRGGALRVLAVGRLVQEKRFDRLLRIVERVGREHRRDVQVRIAGGGPLLESLAEQARARGLADTVEFTGAVVDPLRLYQQADVLLLTSDHEGTPNVALEAMACGLPVIAGAVGGLPEVVLDGRTGYLVPRDDVDAYVGKLLRLAEDSGLRAELGEAAREHVVERFSLESLPEILAGLYGEVRRN